MIRFELYEVMSYMKQKHNRAIRQQKTVNALILFVFSTLRMLFI